MECSKTQEYAKKFQKFLEGCRLKLLEYCNFYRVLFFQNQIFFYYMSAKNVSFYQFGKKCKNIRSGTGLSGQTSKNYFFIKYFLQFTLFCICIYNIVFNVYNHFQNQNWNDKLIQVAFSKTIMFKPSNIFSSWNCQLL